MRDWGSTPAASNINRYIGDCRECLLESIFPGHGPGRKVATACVLGAALTVFADYAITGQGSCSAVPMLAPVFDLGEVLHRLAVGFAIAKAQVVQLLEAFIHARWTIRPFPNKYANFIALGRA